MIRIRQGTGYDQSSNLATKVDNRGITTSYDGVAYDGLNRIQQKSFSGGPSTPSVYYCYDGSTSCTGAATATGSSNGRLTFVGNSNSATQFNSFTLRGLVTGTTQVTSSTILSPTLSLSPLAFQYAYTLTGKLASETYPSGRTVATSYDGADRISKVAGSATAYATLNASPAQAYLPDGKMENFTYGSGATETRTYDPSTYLPTGVTVNASGSNILQLTFGYAASPKNNQNIVNQTITTPTLATLTQTYSYDPINRISGLAETGGLAQTFSYDTFGNMAVTAGVQPGQPNHTPTALSQFNASNQWGTACTPGPCYDAGGNQTAVAGDVYTYDSENRMVTANAQGMGATSYGYDGEDRRVWKTSTAGTTVYGYDAGGALVAEYSTIPPVDNGTQYLSADHLGSTRMITDASGNVVKQFDYVPFGQEIGSGVDGRGSAYGSASLPSAPDVQSVKFTAKERDSETGLDYFGARYFSGPQGRFISPDWAAKSEPVPYANLEDPQTLNLYGYVRNNPLSKADADGHCGLDDPAGCSVGQFFASIPDRVKGGLKFEANAALEMVGAAPKFKASNAEQADAMHSGEEIKPEFQQALATVIPGPKGEKGELVGSNPREVKGRVNTDLPGGHDEATATFVKQTEGQQLKADSTTGHKISEDGTRLRLNPDGTARVDIPASSTRAKHETIHFNPAKKTPGQP